MMDKLKYIVKNPGKAPEVCECELLWQEMEGVVGGWLEKLPVDGGVSNGREMILAYCNEDGKRGGLPFNYAVAGHTVRHGPEMSGEPVFGYKVHGPALFIASNTAGEPVGMTDEQIKIVLKAFIEPHMGKPKGIRL